MNNRNAYFNSVNLESVAGFRITHISSESSTDRTQSVNVLANADGISVSGDYYTTKIITIKGYITRESKGLMEQSLSELREVLDSVESVLKLPVANDVLEYTATPQALILSDSLGGYTAVEIPFLLSDPRGYNEDRTTILDVAGLTTENISYVVSTEGTGTQLPLITITIDAITDGASQLTFGNLTRGESLVMSRTWEVGDILIIDTEAGSVSVNGEETEFVGAMPILNKGNNTLYYDDDFTARTVDIIVSYRKRWL